MKYLTDPKVLSDEAISAYIAEHKRIPNEVFDTVLVWSTTPTSDFVVTRIVHHVTDTAKREFLLVRRAEEPFKDTWFVPGGRIVFQTPEEACRANLKRELGVEGIEPRFVGHQMVFNPPSGNRRVIWPSLWHLFEVHVPFDQQFLPNAESKGIKWFDYIEPDFPDPVKAALCQMGFTEREQ